MPNTGGGAAVAGRNIRNVAMMNSDPILEMRLHASATALAASRDPLPLLETPTGGGAAPLEWIRAALGLAERGHVRFAAWLVLVLGLAITMGAWDYVRNNEARFAESRFERDATGDVRRLENRLIYYEHALIGVAAFASEESARPGGLTADAWRRFVSAIGADNKYPGMRSIGFARRNATTGAIPVRRVFPDNPENRVAIGFDVGRPEVREALNHARDTGVAAISRPVPLIFAESETGFFLYVPVYDPAADMDTFESRRAALIGYVVATFHTREFVTGALAGSPWGVRLAIYDGDGIDPARRIYGDDGPAAATFAMHFGGRQWTFAMSPAPWLVRNLGLENEVAIFGIVVALVLFGMTGALTYALQRHKQVNAVLAQRNALRSSLGEAGRYALVTSDVGAVIDKVLEVTAKALGAECAGLLEYDPVKKQLLRRHGVGWAGDYATESEAKRVGSAAGAAMAGRRTTFVDDWQADARYKISPFLARHGVRSSVNVPIMEQDRPYGVFAVHSTRAGAFGEEELIFIETVAGIVAEAIRRERAGEILHQAQKMEAVGQLTGGIAHDFNNLLTVVLGNMELLLDDARLPGPLRPALETTMQAAARGADLTRKMLAFSRRQPLRSVVIELNSSIQTMDALLKRTLDENVEIEKHLAPDLWKIDVDPTQLETAVLNLAVNARDAMPRGGRLVIETANVELDESFYASNEVPRVGSYICLTVSDTGTGMPPEISARVFEPFFTTKEVGKGTGLGLSMVYGFVRQSGGYVRLYSELGRGTAIRIYLPRAATESDVARAKDAKRALVRGTETILIVEDDPMVRELAVTTIRRLGYDALVAKNGKQALAILDGEDHIDLMFSDIVMPGGMSGPDLAAQAMTRRPGLKVLLTSGYSVHTVTKPGEAELAFPLIAKPYRASDLAARIRAILDADRPALHAVA